MLPPSFMIFPGCCPLTAPLPSPVSPWGPVPSVPRRVTALQECSDSSADSEQGSSSAADKKAFSPGHGGHRHINGAAPALCWGQARLLLGAAKPSLGLPLPLGKCFQPIPALQGGILFIPGFPASSGCEKVAPACGNGCPWLEELGLRV